MKNYSNTPESFRVGGQIKKVSLTTLAQHGSGIVIIGIADDMAIQNVKGRPGARFAPTVIRERLFQLVAPELKIPLYDLGDIQSESNIETTHARAREWIQAVHKAKHIPVVLGGGHDLAFPEARALLDAHPKGSIGFLNVDAHLDLRSTSAGITSGSPWYLLLQEKEFAARKCELVEFGIQPHCNAPALLDTAIAHKVKIHWLAKIRDKRLSAEKQFAKLLQSLGKKHKNLQVSLDIDSVQACQAPGCSAPQVLGFTAAEFIRYSELAGQNKQVRSIGIYEVSPPHDFDHHTSRLAAQAILAFILGVARRKSRL